MENIILYFFKYIKNEETTHLLLKNYSFSSKILLDNFSLNIVLKNHFLDKEGFHIFFNEKYYEDKYYQFLLIKTQNIPDEYLEKYSEFLNWTWISLYQSLTEYQIRKYSNLVNWFFISLKQKMSIPFIIEFKEYIDWYIIIKNPYLNLDFVNKCCSYVDWDSVSRHVILNVHFFKNYNERINWDIVSKERILNEEFIIEFSDLINFKLLAKNNNSIYYSQNIIDLASPFLDTFNIYNIKAKIIQDYWKIKIT